MRINPSAQKIALMIRALDEQIVPELQSESAQATAGIIKENLEDLLKRETVSPTMLRKCLEEGLAITQAIADALDDTHSLDEIPGDVSGGFEMLRRQHEALTDALTTLCKRLVASNLPAANKLDLLRTATQWELSFYAQQADLSPTEVNVDSNHGVPLSQELLQQYLRDACDDSSILVTGFQPLTGGFGKQTYMCAYKTGAGLEKEIVVRKTDPSPIMKHGACDLRNEFDLLTTLAKVDYPAPKPIAFCEKFENIDGPFYTMDRIAGRVPGSFLGGASGNVGEQMCLDLAERLGQLHQLPLDLFADYIQAYEDLVILTGTTEDCYRHSLQGWADYMQVQEHLNSPCLVWLVEWLQHNVPKDPRPPVLVHGDYSIHNVLAKDGRITAIMDWECAGFGCPEQDLAYIRPHIADAIDWDVFVQRYQEHGGKTPNPQAMAFGMAYSTLRTNLAANRATLNLQRGTNRDIRYTMVEQGFTAFFMNAALQSTSQS